jgi:hypothetical protein
MNLMLAAFLLIIGAPEKHVEISGNKDMTCVSVYSDRREVTDVIVKIFYGTAVRENRVQKELWLSRTLTFPVVSEAWSSGPCNSIDVNEVGRVEVKWLIEKK